MKTTLLVLAALAILYFLILNRVMGPFRLWRK